MKKQAKKFLDLIITDIQGHTTRHRNPFMDKILGLIKNNKPIRWYGENITTDEPNKIVTLNLGQLKENLEKMTGMEVRFLVKKPEVTPIYAGKDAKDAVEKAKAIKKKRWPLTRFWRSDKLN